MTTNTITKDDRQHLWDTYVKGGDALLKEMQDNGEIHYKMDFLRTIKHNLMAVGTKQADMASQILIRFIKARGDDAIQFFHLRTLQDRIKFDYWLEVLTIAKDLNVYKGRIAHKQFTDLCRGSVIWENDGEYESVIQESWVKESFLSTFQHNVATAKTESGVANAQDEDQDGNENNDDERKVVLASMAEFEQQISEISRDLNSALENISMLRDRLHAIYRHSAEDDA